MPVALIPGFLAGAEEKNLYLQKTNFHKYEKQKNKLH